MHCEAGPLLSASSNRGGAAKGRQKGSSTSTRKTTARGGEMKSAKARAKSHARRSAGAGGASATGGTSRTVGRPGTADRSSKPGPGDVRMPGRARSSQSQGRGNRAAGPAPKRAK
jgi:hypothetical protein